MKPIVLGILLLAATPALAAPDARVAKKVDKIFAHLDANRDGRITRAEVDQAIAATGKGRRLSKHFGDVDADRDGAISRPELTAAIERILAKRAR
jgi:Ca2+-binding EF-hand superfamily protein